MAIREIIWTVSEDGRRLSPNVPQDGGVQGEHNATRTIFKIPEGCPLAEDKYQLYISCTDATGGYDKTPALTIEGGQVSFDLPRAWTQYGGTNVLTLVAEAAGEIVLELKARVVYHSRQGATQQERKLLEGFMQAACDAAADSATAAAADAAAAGENCQNAYALAVQAGQNAAVAAAAAETAEERAQDAALDARAVAADKERVAAMAQDALQAADAAEKAKVDAETAARKMEDALFEQTDGSFTPEYMTCFYTNDNGIAKRSVETGTPAWQCVVLDVSEHTGATLGVSTYADKNKPIYLTDDNNTVLETVSVNASGNVNTTVRPVNVTVPPGATKLIIHHLIGLEDVMVTGYSGVEMVEKYMRRKDAQQKFNQINNEVAEVAGSVEEVAGSVEEVAGSVEEVVGRVAELEKNGGAIFEDGFVLEYTEGHYTNAAGVAVWSRTDAWQCVLLDVSKHAGATLGVSTYADKNNPLYFTDHNDTILGTVSVNDSGNAINTIRPVNVTVPEGATKLIVHHLVGQPDVAVTGYMVEKYVCQKQIMQARGEREDAVMSQKAVTEALKPYDEAVTRMAFSFRNVDAVCDRYSNEVGNIEISKGEGNRYIDPVNDIYALYDSLVETYPDYVTRKLMGEIIPGDVATPTTDAWLQSGEELPALIETLPIYRYDFKPPMLLGSNTDDVCKILYCSGTHGGEVAPVLQGFRFFKDLCDNWRTQDLLRALRFHCHFTVIPLVNPYGIKFDRKTNERGVNINRNFTKEWVYVKDSGATNSSYGGEAPATELATQLIEAMIAEEQFDFGLDHHTFANFVGTAEDENGLHVGYFVCNEVGRPQDKSFADLVGTWISAKTVSNNPLVTDLSRSYFRTTAGTRFNGYMYGAFPAGYCFETIFNWENDPEKSEMEKTYPCQKFGAEVLGGIFHTAMVSYHSY